LIDQVSIGMIEGTAACINVDGGLRIHGRRQREK
jgi:hypothetical protein